MFIWCLMYIICYYCACCTARKCLGIYFLKSLWMYIYFFDFLMTVLLFFFFFSFFINIFRMKKVMLFLRWLHHICSLLLDQDLSTWCSTYLNMSCWKHWRHLPQVCYCFSKHSSKKNKKHQDFETLQTSSIRFLQHPLSTVKKFSIYHTDLDEYAQNTTSLFPCTSVLQLLTQVSIKVSHLEGNIKSLIAP